MDCFSGGEVGDGAGNLQDSVVGAGAEIQIRHRRAQDLFGIGFHAADLMKDLAAHICIAVGAGLFFVALLLDFAGTDHPLTIDGGGFALFGCPLNWDYLNPQSYSISTVM